MAKSSQWKRFRDFLLMSTSVFALVASNAVMSSPTIVEDTKTEKDSVVVPEIQHPVQTISFRNDTLDHYASALLTYYNNQIIRNFVKNSKIHRMQLPYFSHEKWHHHNKKFTYWKKIKYASSQFIQLRMHEEISANVAAILTADFEYQFMNDKQAVIKKYENTYMKFYFDAIKDGTIKPESTDSIERDKKYELLMNGTIRMWEEKFRAHYTPSLISSLKQYLKNYGFHKPNHTNYQRALTHLYSFGGIDLSKYIKDDAEFIDIRLKMCDELAYVNAFNQSSKQRIIVIDDIFLYGYKLYQFLPSKREAALQHLFIAAKLKFELEKLNRYDLRQNETAITAAYNKVMYQLAKDPNFKKMISNCADTETGCSPFNISVNLGLPNLPKSHLLNEDDFKIIRSFYQFHTVDLTQLIKGFNVNNLPLDNTAFTVFSGRYFSSLPIEKLIHKSPQNVGPIAAEVNQELPTDAYLSSKTNDKVQAKKDKHRVSEDLFLDIPNFEEPLLIPASVTKAAKQRIKEMFDTYNQIPEEFKNCDTEAIAKYIEAHGNPHYFESKISPFKPRYAGKIKNDSLTLARYRRMRQRNN